MAMRSFSVTALLLLLANKGLAEDVIVENPYMQDEASSNYKPFVPYVGQVGDDPLTPE